MTVQGEQQASRFFVGQQCHALRCLPWPTAGDAVQHHLLAIGCSDSQVEADSAGAQATHTHEECFMLADFTTSPDPAIRPDFVSGGTFRSAGGRVTCLEVATDRKRSNAALSVCVLVGSAGGAISAVPMRLPLLSGSTLEDVVVEGVVEEADGTQSTSGQDVHRGPVATVAWHAESDTVATGGADGGIALVSRDAVQSGAATQQVRWLRRATPYASVAGLCWSAGGALLSVGTEGRVMVWDARTRGESARPAACSGTEWAAAGRELLQVVAHPGSPNFCAVAEAGGASLWDLRHLEKPVAWLGRGGGGGAAAACLEGDVVMCFDSRRAGSSEAPLLAASAGGRVSELDLNTRGGGSGAVRELASEEAAFVALDVEPMRGNMVFACTDCASLTVVDRVLRLGGA